MPSGLASCGTRCGTPALRAEQPLHLSITTAGFDRHSICWEQHDYAGKVLDGTIEDAAFFAYICGRGRRRRLDRPRGLARKPTPASGSRSTPSSSPRTAAKRRSRRPRRTAFRRYRLNQWTEQDVRWLNMEKWDACGARPSDLEEGTATPGSTSPRTTDIAALVLVFPDEDRYDVLPFFWVPEEGAPAA